MAEPTDLQLVAQYAKSSGAPSDVYNAACRLLDQQARRDTDPLKRLHDDVEAAGEQIGTAIRYAGRRLAEALNGAESHRDGRIPQTQGVSEGQADTEAQEAAQ